MWIFTISNIISYFVHIHCSWMIWLDEKYNICNLFKSFQRWSCILFFAWAKEHDQFFTLFLDVFRVIFKHSFLNQTQNTIALGLCPTSKKKRFFWAHFGLRLKGNSSIRQGCLINNPSSMWLSDILYPFDLNILIAALVSALFSS